MAATVGKYVLKAADNAADWIKNIEFGKSADAVEELGDTRVMILTTEGLDRYLRYSKPGRGNIEAVKSGGLQSDLYKNNRAPERYANFVEFAEQTDQPIHMPTIKIDPDEGMPFIDDGMVTYRAMADAGLKEIPVLVRKDDVREIMPSIISDEGAFGLSQSSIPVTKPVAFKPKELTPAQQKVFDYEVTQQGRPAHTAKSIALGELDMSPAAKAARKADEGFTGTAYHGGSPDVTNVKDLPDGFWASKNPIVSNTYTRSDTDFRPAMYEIAYNPSQMGQMDTYGYNWNKLEGVDFDINMPSGEKLSFADDLGYGSFVSGQPIEDTNDLARMSGFMGLKGIEIDQINDMGYNIGAARRSFRDTVEKANPGATNAELEKAWGDFLKDYDTKGATNVVITDPSVARSATGAAFDPRNRALPNIMGGSGALAIGLGANESEAGVPDAAAKAVNKAINVRVDKKAGIDYADEILSGNKTFETRNTDSLRPYVGQRIGIARTGAGEAKALGSAEIGEPIVVDEATFRTMQDQHLVPPGTDFDIKPGGTKYLYPVSNPERFDTPKSVGHGIVSRKILGGGTGAAVGLSASDTSQAAVEQLNSIMEGRLTPGFKSRATQAQQVISGKAPINSTQQVVYDTMAAAADPNPDVGSITGVANNPISQGAGNLGFALQNFGSNMQSAGPAGWMVGTAIEDLGNIATRAAYGESKATDPAMAVLDFLALTPGSYMSQGMRTAMSDKDIAPMIFRELLK